PTSDWPADGVAEATPFQSRIQTDPLPETEARAYLRGKYGDSECDASRMTSGGVVAGLFPCERVSEEFGGGEGAGGEAGLVDGTFVVVAQIDAGTGGGAAGALGRDGERARALKLVAYIVG